MRAVTIKNLLHLNLVARFLAVRAEDHEVSGVTANDLLWRIVRTYPTTPNRATSAPQKSPSCPAGILPPVGAVLGAYATTTSRSGAGR